MIPKFAIQAGLGVTAVGGGIGIAVWQLKKTSVVPAIKTDDSKSHEMNSQSSDNSSDAPDVSDFADGYLVKINVNKLKDKNVDDQLNNDLKLGEDKNYLCQWKDNNNTIIDKDCIIKQIQFDANKKVVFLSKIMEDFNNKINIDSKLTETLAKENLKNKKSWFFLKIKDYKFDPELTAPHIDIVSSSEGNDKDKKYATVNPRFKLENNKIKQGKTRTFLVKHKTDKIGETIKNFQCKWNNEEEAKECYVYKFGTQPTLSIDNQSINEISLANTVKLNTSIDDNHYYIISFKEQEQIISSLIVESATIIVVEQENNSNKKGGEFTVINPMIGIIGKAKDSKVENLMLLN